MACLRLGTAWRAAAAAGAAAGFSAGALGQTSVHIVAQTGQVVDGSPIASVNTPFTDGNGKVGFVAALDDGRRIIWYDSGPIFFSADALPVVLGGGESTMGVGDNGEFIYSPSIDGNDGVWTQNGQLAVETMAAPGIPGQFLTFASRPRMQPDGSAAFVGGISPTQGGATVNRVLYRADPAGNLTPSLIGGTTIVDGLTISTGNSIDFDYEISDNGAHQINVLDMNTGSSANDIYVYVDGALVHQEGAATGQGDHWQNFDTVSINDSGNYLFTGDTDGATSSDEFIVYNGVIGLREGDSPNGNLIPSGSSLLAASLNNLNQAAHAWTGGGSEFLFFSPDASNLADSMLLLKTGDLLDTDNDGVADVTLTDLNASQVIGPGLQLAEDGFLYLEVGLTPFGASEFDAVIRLSVAVPSPSSLGVAALALIACGTRRRR